MVLVLTLLSIVVGVSACSGSAVPPQYPYSPPETSPPKTEPSIRPPNSPSGLIGASISQSAVSLQWSDNSNNEVGFNVYRDGIKVAAVNANVTTYQDTGLRAGKSYQYVVTAYNSAGESEACSYTAKTLNPPLNVTINYIGVKFDHDPSEFWQGPGDICLVLVITDGKQTVQEQLPPGGGTYPLNDFQTFQLDQPVFHTPSVGDYLKVSLIAYDDDPESRVSDIIQVALPILGPILGIPHASDISAVFSQYQEETGRPLFENKDDYVGNFMGFWGSDESWGIGQHKAVGTEDFRVWFSIWTDNQPSPIPKPTLLPNVTIQSVDVPPEVEAGKYYSYNITLRNDESRSVNLTLDIKSSITGNVSSESITVLANNSIVLKREIKFEPAGVRTITYSILYKSQEIASLAKTVDAKYKTPTPTQSPLSVEFDGWYVGANKVNTATKNDTVTTRITLSYGTSGQYTMRIRRDIVWASDETLNDLLFSYDGVSDTIALSFAPPYATGEASTDGYHIDLLKDGYIVWTLADAYPPRLRVTIP